nr:class I SAM-dependent methyltransferase [Candidatus Methylospira mobilis]
MPVSLQEKWNAIYSGGLSRSLAPSRVLLENTHLLPGSGMALDLACGLGGNALLMAERGLAAHAWDISDIALHALEKQACGRGLEINTRQCDVECGDLPQESFDVLVVSHFLCRALAPRIVSALKPGGLLFYQTYTTEKLAEEGPRNPDYLLKPGELISLFSALRPLYYREDGIVGDLSLGWRNEAALVGIKSQIT